MLAPWSGEAEAEPAGPTKVETDSVESPLSTLSTMPYSMASLGVMYRGRCMSCTARPGRSCAAACALTPGCVCLATAQVHFGLGCGADEWESQHGAGSVPWSSRHEQLEGRPGLPRPAQAACSTLPGHARPLTWSSFSGVLPVASDRMDSRLCFWARTSRHLMCTSIACRCPVGGSRGCCSMAAQHTGWRLDRARVGRGSAGAAATAGRGRTLMRPALAAQLRDGAARLVSPAAPLPVAHPWRAPA